MDSSIRKAIMKEALGIGAEVKPVPGDENRIYEFRKQLKEIHLFEKKIKLDSEEWTEEHWEQFEESLKASITSSNSGNIMEQVLQNKARNGNKEAEVLHENRVEAIKRMDFSLFEKLL